MRITLILVVALAALMFFLWPQSECVVRRAAFDVGSGTTRMTIADVNICIQTVEKVIHEQQEKVDYKEDLVKSGDRFSEDIRAVGRDVFRRLKEAATHHGVSSQNMAGVATSAFREAKNGSEFIDEVKQEFGLRLRIIAHDEEGKLGYYSAMSVPTVPSQNLVVWDIGGGSMEITTYEKDQFVIHAGDLASVSFKNRILKEVKRSKAESPNPMTSTEVDEALKLAKSYAAESVGADIMESIRRAEGVTYGIGGVLALGVRGQVGASTYGREEVSRVLQQLVGQSDEQIGGAYASTEVTNLILVAGYMDALGIDKVHALQVNNTNGVLMDPRFWEE